MPQLRKYSVPLFTGGLCLLAIGLPFSKFLMSVGQFFLLAGWLLEGNYKQRLNLFMLNRTALLVSAVFFLHLAGLAYTSDFNYGLEDIRKKLPLFALPFLIVTYPLLKKEVVRNILMLFLASVSVASIIVVFKITTRGELTDVREASSFISHIRFSLMMAFSAFISIWLGMTSEKFRKKVFFYSLPAWLIFALIMMQAMTGLIVLGITGLVVAIYLFWNYRSRPFRYISWSLLLFLLISFGFILVRSVSEVNSMLMVKMPDLNRESRNGEIYAHYPNQNITENGHLVYVNLAWKELESAWNQRSELKFEDLDRKGNEIKYTLIRYLTSKGMVKDSASVYSLMPEEVEAIQSGVPNAEYLTTSPLALRLKKLVWEVNNYIRQGDPNGHSLTMRFEFARAAIHAWNKSFLFGVGTGDVRTAFEKSYKEIDSRLEERWRLRAHNQFLEIGVALGMAGLLFFMFSLFYPLAKSEKYSTLVYLAFFSIAFLSMFSDDTLETQAGVTFFAFFNSLLLFAGEHKKMKSTSGAELTVSEKIEEPVAA